MRLLIRGAKQVVCISNSGELFKRGDAMKDVALLEADESGFLSVAVDANGRIAMIGKDHEVLKRYQDSTFDKVIDTKGHCVIPGFVDAHTHPVWDGDRVHEFAMKLSGASYLEIHKAGGGILFTVDKTRLAKEEHLLLLLQERLQRMSRTGTTMVECKSGYGLHWNTELKMLRVLEMAKKNSNLSISSTYCGAHAIPKGKTALEVTKDIVDNQLPELKKLVDKKILNVDSVDVFCEKGVFEVEESKRILTKAKELGFLLNFHAEELNYIGGVEMGASLKAEAMSHLEEISSKGIEAMAAAESVAVLLPTTALILKLKPPPARKLIDSGVPVALGTDFNPNAHCTSMPMAMHLACVQMRMTLKEALIASTLNASHALRKSDQVGTLEIGKMANLVILNAPSWEHVIYQLGGERDVISHVIHEGKVVHEANFK